MRPPKLLSAFRFPLSAADRHAARLAVDHSSRSPCPKPGEGVRPRVRVVSFFFFPPKNAATVHDAMAHQPEKEPMGGGESRTDMSPKAMVRQCSAVPLLCGRTCSESPSMSPATGRDASTLFDKGKGEGKKNCRLARHPRKLFTVS